MKFLGAFEQRRSMQSSPSSSSSSTRKKDKSRSRSGNSLTIASSETSSLSTFALSLKSSRDQDDFDLESREHAATIVETTQKTLRGLLEDENGYENERNNRNKNKNIQYLDRDELIVGTNIAMGGFGWITQVHGPTLSSSHKYVMKTLVPLSHVASDAKLISAAHQLAKERYFLSQLSHPNIISMHAMSRGGLAVIRQTQRLDSYFIIEEYLPVQLTERMKEWRIQQAKQRQPRWPSSKKKMHPQVFLEQVTDAVQIASALQYLHQQRVIFRDIKPANVGLSQDKKIKLFDFGLAVQLPKDADLDALQPSLQGNRVGTQRYMSTEVLRKQPYNVKADVFSFALLLWEMIILDQRPPEGGCGVYGSRPTLPPHWPFTLKRVLQRAWADDFQNDRPHMSEVLLFLQDLQRQLQSEHAVREQKRCK